MTTPDDQSDEPTVDQERQLIRQTLALTPRQRLDEIANVERLVARAVELS